MELARKLSILEARAKRIIAEFTGQSERVEAMVSNSLLLPEIKAQYLHYYQDKVRRFSVK